MVATNVKDVFESHPEWRILSKFKLTAVLKKAGLKVPRSEIDKHFAKSEISQVFKQPQKSAEYRITGYPHSFQIDVVHLPQYKSENGGIEKFLLAIEILSRKCYAFLLDSGQMSEILDKYKTFLTKLKCIPATVCGDDQFNHADFLTLNKNKFIRVHTCVAKHVHSMRQGNKLGILDRSVRTLKSIIKKNMVEKNDTRWAKSLDDVVSLYNATPHSSIENRTPADAYEDFRYLLSLYNRDKQYNKELRLKENKAFSVGDQVRIACDKETFDKEGEGFTRQIYKIKARAWNSFEVALSRHTHSDGDGEEDEGEGDITAGDASVSCLGGCGLPVGPTPRRYMARDLQRVDVSEDQVVRIQDSRVQRCEEAHCSTQRVLVQEGIHRSYGEARQSVALVEKGRRSKKVETVAAAVVKRKKAKKQQPSKGPWYVDPSAALLARVPTSTFATAECNTSKAEAPRKTLRDRSKIHAANWWVGVGKPV